MTPIRILAIIEWFPGALRACHSEVANACVDCCNYHRLGAAGAARYLVSDQRDLHRWLNEYGIEPAASASACPCRSGR